MKAKFASDLRKFIERQKLTQVKAAAFFDVPRPKISKIQGSDLEMSSARFADHRRNDVSYAIAAGRSLFLGMLAENRRRLSSRDRRG
jgi:hypothetical protein